MAHKLKNKVSEISWTGYYNSYFFGEKAGADLIARLAEFAPGKKEKKWIVVWNAEEEFHHRLWKYLAVKKKINIGPMAETIANIFRLADEFVSRKDWAGAMVSSTIIEHISSATAAYLYKYADEETRKIFKRITGDDLGHLNFGITQLEKIAETKDGKKKIIECHKPFLREIMSWPFRDDLLDGELEILNEAYELQRRKLSKFGVSLPLINFERSLKFRIRQRALSLFS